MITFCTSESKSFFTKKKILDMVYGTGFLMDDGHLNVGTNLAQMKKPLLT